MKIVKNKKNENCHFYTREKSLYVAWAYFRNENQGIKCRRFFFVVKFFDIKYISLK